MLSSDRNSFAVASGTWSGAFAPIKPGLKANDKQTRTVIVRLSDYEFELARMTNGLNVFENTDHKLQLLLEDLESGE